MGRIGKPLITQYHKIKEEYLDYIVLFQVGSFYQMYYTDAQLVSDTLHLKLVSRDIGGGMEIPMCGIPQKSADKHIQELLLNGYGVVVCNQVSGVLNEDGITKREIAEVKIPKGEMKKLKDTWIAYMETHTFEKKEKQKSLKQTLIKNENLLVEELCRIDLDYITPKFAMDLLYEWKKKYG